MNIEISFNGITTPDTVIHKITTTIREIGASFRVVGNIDLYVRNNKLIFSFEYEEEEKVVA